MPLEQGRMQGFVASLLAESGGLVEAVEPDGLEVLAPPPLQQALGVGEFCRFGFGASLPAGAVRVGIESDWLSRFGGVLGQRGRWNRRMVAPPSRARAPDAEAVLARDLVLDNASIRLLSAAPAWTRYLVLDFRYTAVADEKREGTVRLALNLATGALAEGVFGQADLWTEQEAAELAADRPAPEALPADWARAAVIERVHAALPWRVEASLAPFVTGLRRRLARDLDRLHGYHNDLHRESARKAAQANASEAGQAREAMRMAAIVQEYRAKVDDLAHKYALRVTAEWIQTQEFVMPVHRLSVQVRRRKAERTLLLDWNMAARRLESPPCEAGFSADRPRLVCDDALHLVAPAGLAACAGCGRAYCRACHVSACPKCGHADGLAAFAQLIAGKAVERA